MIVLAATNRPDILDRALLVLEDLIGAYFGFADIKDREAILKIHSKGKPFSNDVDLSKVAIRTPGFSGADLANLMNESAIWRHAIIIRLFQDDLYNSMEKVLLGPERKGRVINENERKIIAYHEAGHALVAASLKDSDPVHKISIISRGHAGGYTLKLPMEELHLHNKSQFVAEIAVGLAICGGKNVLANVHRRVKRLKNQQTGKGAGDAIRDERGIRAANFRRIARTCFLGKEIASEKIIRKPWHQK